MGKSDPQTRAESSLEQMIRSRQRAKARAEADDWLARGWNPFLRQQDGGFRPRSGFELMSDLGGWSDWQERHKERLGELARAGLKSAPGGKLLGQRRALEALCKVSVETDELKRALDWGLDPNEKGWGHDPAPLLFNAGRGSAQLLIKAGATPLERDPNGKGIWERWAERACGSGLRAEDVRWIGEHAPAPKWESASKRDGYRLGGLALRSSASQIARLMVEHGAGAAAFGAQTEEGLKAALRSVSYGADTPEMLTCLGEACGWERVVRAAVSPRGADQGAPEISVAASLADKSHVRSLGALEEHGLLEAASALELASQSVKLWSIGNQQRDGRGLAWLVGRFKKGQAQEALELWVKCALFGQPSIPVAERLATRGWIPASGPFSLNEVYKGGERWRGPEGGKSFSEFSALCEKKALRQNTVKKAPVKRASARL